MCSLGSPGKRNPRILTRFLPKLPLQCHLDNTRLPLWAAQLQGSRPAGSLAQSRAEDSEYSLHAAWQTPGGNCVRISPVGALLFPPHVALGTSLLAIRRTAGHCGSAGYSPQSQRKGQEREGESCGAVSHREGNSRQLTGLGKRIPCSSLGASPPPCAWLRAHAGPLGCSEGADEREPPQGRSAQTKRWLPICAAFVGHRAPTQEADG